MNPQDQDVTEKYGVNGTVEAQEGFSQAPAPRAMLVASLEEMMGVYWGNGDGEIPEPGCIIRARAALAAAKGEA